MRLRVSYEKERSLSPDRALSEVYVYYSHMSTDSELKYDNIEIGKMLTQFRKEKGYSTYKLSIESGVSSGVIVRLEQGTREPKINTRLRILNGLRIKPSEFFSRLD